MRWNVDVSPLNELLLPHVKAAHVYQEILMQFRDSSEIIEYFALQRLHRLCSAKLIELIRCWQPNFQVEHIMSEPIQMSQNFDHPLSQDLITSLKRQTNEMRLQHETVVCDPRMAPEWKALIGQYIVPYLDEARSILNELSSDLPDVDSPEKAQLILEIKAHKKESSERSYQREQNLQQSSENRVDPSLMAAPSDNGAFVLPRSQWAPAFQ